MINYMYGRVCWAGTKTIIFEQNYSRYTIRTKENELWNTDSSIKLYVFQINKLDVKNNINTELYGFLKSDERNLFKDLVSVRGIGVIIAINILQNDIKTICNCIEKGDVLGLQSLKGISIKNSHMICETLTKKYIFKNSFLISNSKDSNKQKDISNALIKLGYSKKEIVTAFVDCDLNQDYTNIMQFIIKKIAMLNA